MQEIEAKKEEEFSKCGTMLIWEMMADMTDEQKKEFDENMSKLQIPPLEPK